jgi:hypothetical protein
MKKKLYLSALLVVVSITMTQAQSGGLTLYNMERIPYSNQLNPARFPKDTKMFFGLPAVDFSAESPFSYRDIIVRGKDDSLRINLSHLSTKLRNKNKGQLAVNSQLIGFGIKINDSLFITFSASIHSSFNFNFSKDLINFVVKGNEPYLGKSAFLIKNGIGGVSVWTEYGVGAGYKINEKLTVGVKPKILFGIMNISTKSSNFSIYTSPSGDMLRANSKININTSLPEDGSFSSFVFHNPGVGIDLGGMYAINKMFDVAASIIDLGFINWKNNNTRYRSNKETGEFEFYGLTWDDLWKDDKFNSDLFRDFSDTLKSVFSLDTLKNAPSYRVMTPTKVFLSGTYHINDQFKVNTVYRMLFAEKSIYSAFALNAHYYSGKWFEAGIGNTIIGRSFFNPSLAMNVSFGGVFQIFSTVDFSSLQLAKMKTFNAHFGINILLK